MKIVENIEIIFGIVVFDDIKRLFCIPIYLEDPIAIISTHEELVNIHIEGCNNLISRGKLIRS